MTRTVATADAIYVDPSALLKLYLNGPESRAMTAWRARLRRPLSVTHHGRVELMNGIALAAYRKLINEAAFAAALAALDEDFEQGRCLLTDVLGRAALKRAADLSRTYSRTLGTRSWDVLHVACALELECRTFVSFDGRQQDLARAVALKIVVPAG